MSAKVAIAVFVLLVVLHHDTWNWDNRSLWLGFIPAGLGYHAFYSMVCAGFWALVNRFAWPHRTEAWAEGGEGV
jgi:hypothetical protein